MDCRWPGSVWSLHLHLLLSSSLPPGDHPDLNLGGLLSVLVLQRPQRLPHCGEDWDVPCSLYIIPFLVKQKIEVGCFRFAPSFHAPSPAASVPPNYLLFSSPWSMDFVTA